MIGVSTPAARAAAEASDLLGDWSVRGQLALEIPAAGDAASREEGRTYWENREPCVWEPVVVRVRYATGALPAPHPALSEVRTGRKVVQNVLVERPDGTRDVRPVRLLRTRCPR